MSGHKDNPLDYLRMHYIDELRISMTLLKECATNTLRKIDSEGISGYYSVNSDVGRYSEKAWRASWALGELKRFDENINQLIDSGVQDRLAQLIEDIKQKKEKDTEK